MKIPMWWTAGFQFAATSPLAYTLQYTNNYCYGGHVKENKYLLGCDPMQSEDQKYNSKSCLDRLINNSINGLHLVDTRYPPIDIKKIWTPPNNVEKYIKYYQCLWDLIKNDYKAVADFSNPNQRLTTAFLDVFAPKLLEVFDIKVGIIVRDPVRRCWSDIGQRNINRFTSDDISMKYFEVYDKLSKYFPTHFIVMEELWEGDGSEKNKLSSFIDYPLRDLYRNVFAPDRGHLQEFDEELKDQCNQPKELTLDDYIICRQKFARIYDEWHERFGRLPLYWGKPLIYV